MGDGANRVHVLKKRFQELKDELDEKDETVHKLTKELTERNELIKSNETELAAMNRKISLLEDDLESTNTRLQTATDMLEEASKGADESERSRNALEKRSCNDGSRIEDLEMGVSSYKKEALDWEAKFVESARKCVMMETDLERLENRNEDNEARVKELEGELDRSSYSFKSLQVNIEQRSDQEKLYEEKIKVLTDQVNQLELKSDDTNSLYKTTLLDLQKAEEDFTRSEAAYQKLQYEYSNTLSELTDM